MLGKLGKLVVLAGLVEGARRSITLLDRLIDHDQPLAVELPG